MSVLFFHLVDGVDTMLDPEGVELPDAATARSRALEAAYSILAAEIAEGVLDLDKCMEVMDGEGALVHRVRFRDIVKIKGLELAY